MKKKKGKKKKKLFVKLMLENSIDKSYPRFAQRRNESIINRDSYERKIGFLLFPRFVSRIEGGIASSKRRSKMDINEQREAYRFFEPKNSSSALLSNG